MRSSAPSIPVASFEPGQVSLDWAADLGARLEQGSWDGYSALQTILPAETAVQILEAATTLLKQEPTVVDVVPPEPGAAVRVVGDTHGQLHDVRCMLDTVGYPSPASHMVFNGDFVDRGAWGLEVLVLLAALKLAAPACVTLLRGNHESSTCTQLYGFRTELVRKYGPEGFVRVYKACKQLFAALPLAALVGGATLVLHGGLFRRPHMRSAARGLGKNGAAGQVPRKRKRNTPTRLNPGPPMIGSLQDLRAASKGGVDPNGCGASTLATDVLWSDPAAEPGIHTNDARGVGLIFGPDVTQAFLAANGLRLIIRSHEGPDARCDRADLPDMSHGFAIDHVTPAGRLVTVFSAPDYPQFQADDQDRYENLGAVAVLHGPSWDEPAFKQFRAVHPRPQCQATYEYNTVPGSDEEMEWGLASDASAASDVGASEYSNGLSEGEGPGNEPEDARPSLPGAVSAADSTAMAMAATAQAVAQLQLEQRAKTGDGAMAISLEQDEEKATRALQDMDCNGPPSPRGALQDADGSGPASPRGPEAPRAAGGVPLQQDGGAPMSSLLPNLALADSGYLADTEGNAIALLSKKGGEPPARRSARTAAAQGIAK